MKTCLLYTSGSTANGTAVLREDEVGLWGSVEINEKDQDVYKRQRQGIPMMDTPGMP